MVKDDPDYTKPEYNQKSFHCPYCGIFSSQKWSNFYSVNRINNDDVQHFMSSSYEFIKAIHDRHTVSSNVAQSIITLGCSMFKNFRPTHYYAANCQNCNSYSIWVNENMIYPPMIAAPPAHNDMPENIKEVYEEARLIFAHSPRATAALLRVTLQKLTEYFEEKEGCLYTRIQKLVQKGLPEAIIKTLPTMGIVISEDSENIGAIDLDGNDDSNLAFKLFRLVNFIIRETITKPKEIDSMFNASFQDISD